MPTGGVALIAAAVIVAMVVFRRLFPAGIQTYRLLRRHRSQAYDAHAIEMASEFQQGLDEAEKRDATDDRSWQDLDLDEVFLTLDRTVSRVGSQYLYHRLRTPQTSASLDTFDRAVEEFTRNPDLASRVRAALAPLDDERSAQIAYLLSGSPPRTPRFAWTFALLTATSLGCLIALPFWPRALIVWIVVCVINVIVQIAIRPRMRRFIPAIHEIPKFVRAAAALSRLTVPGLEQQCRALGEGAARLRALRGAASWLMFEPGQTNELAASIYEYVNLFLLLDVNAFAFASRALTDLRPSLRATFDALGYIDAAQSVAAWRSELPAWTRPTLGPAESGLLADDVHHPLIENAVANSIRIDGRGVLITGSNMSGKTTFVRTVGLNAVLAQTIFTVCARRWVAPLLRVRTSIRRADNLLEGKSYYLAEAESVRDLLAARRPDVRHLFLLDEIFRGTNTPERIAASYAVLKHLVQDGDLVVVATHDVELIGLLGDAYESYHFREEITENAITFDHRIRPGPSSSTNAIALLGLLGYPDRLLEDARHALSAGERDVRAGVLHE